MRRRENQIKGNDDLSASEDVAPVTALVPEQQPEATNQINEDTMTTDNATANNTQNTFCLC